MTVFNTIYDPKTRMRMPFWYPRALEYMSGRWHRRDGDTYANIPPQPPIKLAEPESADDPSGDIRSTTIS